MKIVTALLALSLVANASAAGGATAIRRGDAEMQASGSQATAGGQAVSPAADAAGLEVVNRVCTACHDRSIVANARKPAADWPPVIERMRGYGAILSDDDTKFLMAYLAAHNTNGP